VITAGVGWYQRGDGHGDVVESEATGPTPDVARVDIRSHNWRSLHDLCNGRNVDYDSRRIRMKENIDTVFDMPTTDLVVAVYQAEWWR
jgi:hypothetical protein